MNSLIKYLQNGLAIVGALSIFGYWYAIFAARRDFQKDAKEMFWIHSKAVMMIAGFIFLLWVFFCLLFLGWDVVRWLLKR